MSMLCGCARWKEPISSDPAFNDTAALRPARESSHRLLVEIEFVNVMVDATDPEYSAELWQWVDETVIDARVRQQLLANGIRTGFVSSEERFRAQLSSEDQETDVVDEFLAEASVASEISHGTKRLPMRFGKRVELALRQPIEGSHVAMLRHDGETIGRTLQNAQYMLAMTVTQAGTANQVQLNLRPEIQHGDTRQKWVSSGSAIRIDSRRETWSMPELDLSLLASEGDLIVFAPTQPLRGLAKHMLAGSGSNQEREQLVVLIRVLQVPSAADQL